MTRSNRWLNNHLRNVTSQNGEDGVIEKALEVIGTNDRYCVEFGAWDGITYSNTHHLVENKGYSAVLIEADRQKFRELQKNYRENSRAILINSFVGFEGDTTLDAIFKKTPLPQNFDLLSIDIDGFDYHVWEALHDYRPKIVVIEYNPTIPPHVEFVQPRDANVNQGSSLRSLNLLAAKKRYELICATYCNAIFVDRQYFLLFEIEDNSLEEMGGATTLTYLYQGYDGTIFLSGCDRLCWHEVPFNVNKIQQLPKIFRRHMTDYGPFRLRLFRIFEYLRKKKLL